MSYLSQKNTLAAQGTCKSKNNDHMIQHKVKWIDTSIHSAAHAHAACLCVCSVLSPVTHSGYLCVPFRTYQWLGVKVCALLSHQWHAVDVCALFSSKWLGADLFMWPVTWSGSLCVPLSPLWHGVDVCVSHFRLYDMEWMSVCPTFFCMTWSGCLCVPLSPL